MVMQNSGNDARRLGAPRVDWPALSRETGSRLCLLVAGLSVAILAGCSAARPAVDHNEDLVSANIHAHSFAGTGQATCEAARRALLGQGYIVTEAKASLVKGGKNFQRDGGTHVQIEFNVVCAPDSEGSNTTTAFANAVRDIYSLKKSSTSASVGIGVLGSLSVPFGSTDESLVKVGSETIGSKKFYDRFFELVDSNLDAPDPGGDNVKPADQVTKHEKKMAPKVAPSAAPSGNDMDPDS
jgi:hypothetical protein